MIKLLLPLCGLYGWEVDNKDEVGKYALEIVGDLLKNYPEMYPTEFHEFSDLFKEIIAIDYSVHYVKSEIWDLSPLVRVYSKDESDYLSVYMDILLCRLAPSEKYTKPMPPIIHYMTEKDMKVMVKLVERLLNQSDDLIKKAIEDTKSKREYFQMIKDLFSQG